MFRLEEFRSKINDISSDPKLKASGEPKSWLAVADEFYRAAEVVGKNIVPFVEYEIEDAEKGTTDIKVAISPSRTYFYLMGSAIEYLIKGHIIYQNPSLLTKGNFEHIETRNFTTLIKEIKEIELDDDEFDIVKRIEQVIPYWGRFPIPLGYIGIIPDIGVDLRTKDLIEGVYWKFASRLYKLINDDWTKNGGNWKLVYVQKYEDYLEHEAYLERFKRGEF